MVGELPIPNPFPSGKGLLLCDKLACLREGLIGGGSCPREGEAQVLDGAVK